MYNILLSTNRCMSDKGFYLLLCSKALSTMLYKPVALHTHVNARACHHFQKWNK